jgi:hypothetical protein
LKRAERRHPVRWQGRRALWHAPVSKDGALGLSHTYTTYRTDDLYTLTRTTITLRPESRSTPLPDAAGPGSDIRPEKKAIGVGNLKLTHHTTTGTNMYSLQKNIYMIHKDFTIQKFCSASRNHDNVSPLLVCVGSMGEVSTLPPAAPSLPASPELNGADIRRGTVEDLSDGTLAEVSLCAGW